MRRPGRGAGSGRGRGRLSRQQGPGGARRVAGVSGQGVRPTIRQTVPPIGRNPVLTRRFVVSPEQFGTLFLGRNDGAAAASDEPESPGHWGMV